MVMVKPSSIFMVLCLFISITVNMSSNQSFVPVADYDSDECHWASSFINWSFAKNSIEGTRSRSSLSWLDWGIPLTEPANGSIAVIEYADGRGHVGMVVGVYNGMIVLLGGNQADKVCYTAFPIEDIKSYRWPKNRGFNKKGYILKTVYPEGVSKNEKLYSIDKSNYEHYRLENAEYFSLDMLQKLTFKKLNSNSIEFSLSIKNDYNTIISGIAYELYPEDFEIDIENGIGYPVYEYIYWDNASGSKGMKLRISCKGDLRARVIEWGYDSTLKISKDIMRSK